MQDAIPLARRIYAAVLKEGALLAQARLDGHPVTGWRAARYAVAQRLVLSNLRSFLGLQNIKTAGLDLEVAYRFNLSRLFSNAPGDVRLRFLGTLTKEFVISDGVTSIDRVGEMLVGTTAGNAQGGPKRRFTLSGTYRNGPWTVFAQTRFVGGGVIDAAFD